MAARALIKVSERVDLDSTPEKVWAFLQDIEAVANCITGAELWDKREDGSYTGKMRVQLGPTTVDFAGDLSLEVAHETREGRLVAKGADKRGTKARSAVSYQVVQCNQPASSALLVEGSVEVLGPLAPFARTGGQHLVKRMVRDFATNVAVAFNDVPPLTSRTKHRQASGRGGSWLSRLIERLRLRRSRRRVSQPAAKESGT